MTASHCVCLFYILGYAEAWVEKEVFGRGDGGFCNGAMEISENLVRR